MNFDRNFQSVFFITTLFLDLKIKKFMTRGRLLLREQIMLICGTKHTSCFFFIKSQRIWRSVTQCIVFFWTSQRIWKSMGHVYKIDPAIHRYRSRRHTTRTHLSVTRILLWWCNRMLCWAPRDICFFPRQPTKRATWASSQCHWMRAAPFLNDNAQPKTAGFK